MNTSAPETAPPPGISRSHLKRLKIYYRSAGWPVKDNLEIDLIVAGLAERRIDPSGHEAIYVTDAGIQALAGLLSTNRAAFDAHEALVAKVVEYLQQRGWITFTGRSFKVKPEEKWITVRPDVFALPKTLDERRIVPCVYEVKVSRADLRSELRKGTKRLGYEAISRRMYYVMPEEIANEALLAEIPASCGVLLQREGSLFEHRLANERNVELRPIHWLQLLASCRDPSQAEHPQQELNDSNA